MTAIYQLYSGLHSENATDYICTLSSYKQAVREYLNSDGDYYEIPLEGIRSITIKETTYRHEITICYIDMYDDLESQTFYLMAVKFIQ